MAHEKPARKAHREAAVAIPAAAEPRPLPPLPPESPAVPQGPSNTATNTTGPVTVTAPFNPMQELKIATGPNPDGLRHQGLVAAQGQPGMDSLTTDAVRHSRAPAPKEQ